jgi:hypothetical protein
MWAKEVPILCRKVWQEYCAVMWMQERNAWDEDCAEEHEWSGQEAADLHRKALKEAAEIARAGVSDGFEESRQRTVFEFGEFLSKVRQGLSVKAATDLDVIAFIQGWWVPSHVKPVLDIL